MTLDLTQYLNKKVTLIRRNASPLEGILLGNNVPSTRNNFPIRLEGEDGETWTFTVGGWHHADRRGPLDIVGVTLVEPALDLTAYIGKIVEVKYSSGETKLVSVEQNETPNSASYPVRVNGASYTEDGNYWRDDRESEYDIVSITEVTQSFPTPSKTLKALHERKTALEAELKDLESEIKRKGKDIPDNFQPEEVVKYLDSRHPTHLFGAFCWESSKQGHSYWDNIHEGRKELDSDDVAYLADCIRQYYA